LRDTEGIRVEVDRIEWRRIYARVIEGTAPGVTRQELERLEPDARGWLVVGRDARRHHSSGGGVGLPEIKVRAELSSAWAPDGFEEYSAETDLTVVWFQDDVDPFQRLVEIVAGIDWAAWSRVERR
jgi:hypothetical protein